MSKLLIVDCHAHLYHPDRERYPTIPKPLLPPDGAGSLEHLQREMAKAGIGRAMIVQTGTAYRWDNRMMAETVAAHDDLAGVCTLDPENPASPDILSELVERYPVRGLRSVPAGQGTSDARLDHPGVEALWARAESLGIVVNPLIHVHLADDLERLLERHPLLPVVLDHCMYPKAAEGMQGETLQRVLALARYPNLHAKLTWMIESSSQPYPFEDTRPMMRDVIDAFGPERCVWGSDFPLELWTPAGTYQQHISLFREALGLNATTLDTILRDTPDRLWFQERDR